MFAVGSHGWKPLSSFSATIAFPFVEDGPVQHPPGPHGCHLPRLLVDASSNARVAVATVVPRQTTCAPRGYVVHDARRAEHQVIGFEDDQITRLARREMASVMQAEESGRFPRQPVHRSLQ